MKSVRVELLQELVGQLPEIIARDSDYQASTAFALERWIKDRGLEVIGPTGWNGGQRWIFETCPWNPDHRNRSAFILQFPNGAVAAGCLHNSCRDKDWHSLRDVIEPGWRATRQSAVAASENARQQPLPFHRFDLPPFPSDVLPTWLRAFVEAEARATQTPVDLAGMLSLSVLAAACAKKVVVSVREGYCEPVNIFTINALPSGTRKTAVFAAAVKPLEDYEQSEASRTADAIARKQAAQKIKEATLRKLQDQAVQADAKKREKVTEEASSLAAELANAPMAVPARYIVDDCTPKKLPGLLRTHWPCRRSKPRRDPGWPEFGGTGEVSAEGRRGYLWSPQCSKSWWTGRRKPRMICCGGCRRTRTAKSARYVVQNADRATFAARSA